VPQPRHRPQRVGDGDDLHFVRFFEYQLHERLETRVVHHGSRINLRSRGAYAGCFRRRESRDAVHRRGDVHLVEDLGGVFDGDQDGLDVRRVQQVALQVLGLVQLAHGVRGARAVLRGEHELVVRPLAVLEPDAIQRARVALDELHQILKPAIGDDERSLLAPQAPGAARQAARDAVQRSHAVDGGEAVQGSAHNIQNGVRVLAAQDGFLQLQLLRLIAAARAREHGSLRRAGGRGGRRVRK
jgi:hypothetical protein